MENTAHWADAPPMSADDTSLAAAAAPVPLTVDVDGTLICSDLLVESAFGYLSKRPAALLDMLKALKQGKAQLKAAIASETSVNVASLPYDQRVIALIEQARAEGRPVYLASASNERYVRAVADHLGLFDGIFASDDTVNLSSHRKAERLVQAFGMGGFDYVGNDEPDLEVWKCARKRIAVRTSTAVKRRLMAMDRDAHVIEESGSPVKAWAKMLRVHQWTKNALVFVPLLTAQAFGFAHIVQAVVAFVAFSLTASAIYIINDLVDIESDRQHPTKCRRPLAAGTVSILKALAVSPLLVVLAAVASLTVSVKLFGVLFVYLVMTTAYSFSLKRKLLADVVVLALLYSVRVVGGAAAIGVALSQWLLGFSLFIFASLALVKRYTELAARLDADLPDPTNRNYRKADLEVIAALSAAAGFNAVTVFALYISSEAVHTLYHEPTWLWLVCPLLMYWISRVIVLAHRREMHDDPIVFALTDRVSLTTAALIGVFVFAAM